MDMAILQFYQNKFRYPKYSNTITAYGSPLDCTPVGVNLRSGTLRVKGTFTDFMSCNYLALTRNGKTIYAWVDDVRFRTEDSFEVSYTVDAWRTYKGKINLGNQFIVRQPQSTTKRDPMLGTSVNYPVTSSYQYSISDPTKRIFVVQVRANSGEPYSRTPVNPTPYQFFVKSYDINNWTADTALDELMSLLSFGAETQNIVTMYSIPYMDISTLQAVDLPVTTPSGTTLVTGFKLLNGQDPSALLKVEVPITIPDVMDNLMRVDHSVQLVIPEAGVITIPDELLTRSDLKLRQDVDLFSGACNYMLMAGTNSFFTHSVRGSSVSSIPIVSDPMDTYLSQNQNALTTSLIGDVASIAGGVAMMSGAGPLAGAGALASAFGGGTVISGINNIINRGASILDHGAKYSNPPAFLGTALVSNFNQKYWLVITKVLPENETEVHANFGYPINMFGALTFPTSGFIQTEGCNVESTDGSVPRWALDEIDMLFNNGILVK